jgi:formylglycine-generating enzyme required for sulfatase activity/serine/threonine protein kinase
MIAVICPGCKRKLSIKDDYAGKTGTCPHCKGRIKVPVVPAADPTLGGHESADEVTLSPPSNPPPQPVATKERLDFLTPPQSPDEIGRLGSYRVLKVLGAGGMGMVLLAEDPLLKRMVALKVMRAELAAAADARERFLREAQATAAIEHPHIIHVYQVSEDRGVPFLAMPFLKGEPLDERLKRLGRLRVDEAVSLGRQIAEGLAAAHAAGLIHRDIKPGNVFLVSAEESPSPGVVTPGRAIATPGLTTHHSPLVKILDFGLARATTGDDVNLTKTGAILGTPAYMAPEQARAGKVDHRSDLFSLGGVLYRMLTGEQPFKGNDPISLLMALATEIPKPVRELNPEVPLALAELVMRLLEKDPSKRPASARVVAEQLAALGEDRTIVHRPTGGHTAARGEPSRSRWLIPVAVSGGALLGLIVAALIFLKLPGNKDKQTPDNPSGVYPDPAGTIVNAVGMKMVPVQPGQFWMGSPRGEPGRRADETEHVVVLTKPFFMGMHEVTVGQFATFVKDTGYVTEAERNGEGSHRVRADGKWEYDVKTNWRNPGFEQADDHPVVCVSFADALEFCNWLTGKDGKKYTLPTEAQWEYCCRAGTRTRFCFGDDENELDSHAWFANNSSAATHPVGQKKPNAWGLFDMHGNASEWTSDRYDKDYYVNCRRDDPGRAGSGNLVSRGGGWFDLGVDLRAASRRGIYAPGKSATHVGFRVAMLPHYIITSPATGMSLIEIQPGRFQMGANPAEAGSAKNARLHEVIIARPFWMGRHEVTVGQFRAFVNDTKYRTEAETTGEGARKLLPSGNWVFDAAITWRNPGFPQADDHPVVCVSWNDAVKFCEWLSKKDGKRYALPTEAQWEYCCRAGTRSRYTSGSDDKALARYGWYEANSEKKTHPVGQKPPNSWNLFDMHGNASEWCSDWYEYDYDKGPVVDPPGPPAGKRRVRRGGGWATLAGRCRAAFRANSLPNIRDGVIGFRVVRLPEPVVTNSIGIKLALVPVGSFKMGSPGNEPFHRNDENQHDVAITRPFYLGVHEVTVGQFKVFVKETSYQTEAEQGAKGTFRLFPDGTFRMDVKRTWRDPGFEQTDQHPVVGVTWADANAFCAWLSKKEGSYYRMPTEAEWEYACRAGSQSRFFFGNDETQLGQYAWFGANSGMKTHPVGQKKPNAWGLYDMYGNAAEMTADRYGADYFRSSPAEDPPGPVEGDSFPRRGGGWFHGHRGCRSAHRESRLLSHRIVDQGFRVMLAW